VTTHTQDRIMDEARELALNQVLHDPTDADIVEAVAEILELPNLHSETVGGMLALASYHQAEKELWVDGNSS
jgi:hypothetical protein